jgi:DNA-binding IclR family transcriptional regulator
MISHEAYPGTQAVLRAIALLKAFTDVQPELGLSELARAAGLNKTTTYRLLTALESEGMVARSPARETYRLGPDMIVLGSRALRGNDLRSASRAELEALAQSTGETATLEILAGGRALILDEVTGQRHLLGATQFVGTRWPLHATSTGKVLLAYLSDAQRKAVLRPPLARLTAHTLTRLAVLRKELARVREQGYAMAIEEVEVGYVAVGAPVRNHEGNVVAAISLGGPGIRLTTGRIREIASLVMQAAEQISKRLGFRADMGRG